MKKILLRYAFIFIFLFNLSNNNLFAQVVPEWATSFAMNYPLTIDQMDMTTDKSGNVYISGTVHDTSWKNVQIITLKYNSDGQILWFKYFDSVNYITKLTVDNIGNVYVAGHKDTGYVTVKYNSQGIQQWAKSYVTISGQGCASDIITDDSSNVYITGIANNGKFTTVKYNSSGVFKWVAIDGSTSGLTYSYLTLDNNRNIYLLNRGFDTINNVPVCSTIKYNSEGSKKWERYYKGNFIGGGSEPIDLKYDPSGYLYVLAYGTDWNDGDYNLVKYDTLGNQIWAFAYSLTSYKDWPKSLVLDKKGNAYITGEIYPTGGTIDSIATIKVSNSGVLKWKRTYSTGYSGADGGRSIAIDSLGYLYVAGWGSDIFNRQNSVTIKYDSLGDQIWIAKYQNTFSSYDFLNSISLDKFGNVYLSGTTMETNSTGILTLKYSNTVGINEISNFKGLKMYPNPVSDILYIESEQYFEAGTEIEITNTLGQVILKLLYQKEIDVSYLSQGYYILKIILPAKKTIHSKFIKE